MDKNSIAKRKGMGNNAERILLFLVVSQILFLLIFNVCRMKYMVNFDSSTYMVQVCLLYTSVTVSFAWEGRDEVSFSLYDEDKYDLASIGVEPCVIRK